MYENLKKLFYKGRGNVDKIYARRFECEASVKLNFKIKNNPAFFLYIPQIVTLLDRIDGVNKDLVELKENLPSTAISFLTDKFLMEEVISTNGLEGVDLNYDEVLKTFEFVKAKTGPKKYSLRFNGLIKNYFNIDQPLKLTSPKDIRILYDEILLPEIDNKNRPDGKLFRKSSVSLYSSTMKEVHRGTYGEERIKAELQQALSILQDKDLPVLIRAAIFHYLIGYIHPFYDGNGRLNRFISSYLISTKLDQLVSFRLSYSIKNDLKNYYKVFDTCNDEKNKGDLTPFILSFLEFIKSASEDALKTVLALQKEVTDYRKRIDSFELKEEAKNILLILAENTILNSGKISLSKLQAITGKAKTTIQRFLKEIEEKLGPDVIRTDKKHREFRYSVNLFFYMIPTFRFNLVLPLMVAFSIIIERTVVDDVFDLFDKK